MFLSGFCPDIVRNKSGIPIMSMRYLKFADKPIRIFIKYLGLFLNNLLFVVKQRTKVSNFAELVLRNNFSSGKIRSNSWKKYKFSNSKPRNRLNALTTHHSNFNFQLSTIFFRIRFMPCAYLLQFSKHVL